MSFKVYTNALKHWTGKSRATIIYDSTVDEFTYNGLFEKVKGKRNIALIGTTTEGDVFGGFYNLPVTKRWEEFYNPTIFAFSFESHGRCATPQRFAVKERVSAKGYVRFYKNLSTAFVVFGLTGVGGFLLGNEQSDSSCNYMADCFEGLQNTTLTGSNRIHHCTRLVAVQLS